MKEQWAFTFLQYIIKPWYLLENNLKYLVTASSLFTAQGQTNRISFDAKMFFC